MFQLKFSFLITNKNKLTYKQKFKFWENILGEDIAGDWGIRAWVDLDMDFYAYLDYGDTQTLGALVVWVGHYSLWKQQG